MTKNMVIIDLKTQPGKRDELISLWHEHLEEADSNNPDLSEVFVVTDEEDADTTRLVELYNKPDGFDRSFASEAVQGFVAAATPLLESGPAASRSTAIWSKTSDIS